MNTKKNKAIGIMLTMFTIMVTICIVIIIVGIWPLLPWWGKAAVLVMPIYSVIKQELNGNQ